MSKTSYIQHKDGRIVARGSLQIILPDEHLREIQNMLQQNLKQIAANDSEYTLTGDEFQAEIDRLVNIAKSIVDPESGIDIFNFIPLTKTGSFFKDRNILIADSKCAVQANYGYPVNDHIQLRLVPAYANVAKWLAGNSIDNMKCLAIQRFDALKKQEPIFDRDSRPHAITPAAKAKYLKDDEIQPGHLYEEKSGSKYLYLTGLPLTEERRYNPEPGSGYEYMNTDGEMPGLQQPLHWYLRWTDTLAKKCKGDTSFNNIIRVLANHEKENTILNTLSCRENPRKFVSHAGQLFDPAGITPETIASPEHNTWTMQRVKIYTVYKIKGGKEP